MAVNDEILDLKRACAEEPEDSHLAERLDGALDRAGLQTLRQGLVSNLAHVIERIRDSRFIRIRAGDRLVIGEGGYYMPQSQSPGSPVVGVAQYSSITARGILRLRQTYRENVFYNAYLGVPFIPNDEEEAAIDTI